MKIIGILITAILLTVFIVWYAGAKYDKAHKIIILNKTGIFTTPEKAAYATDMDEPILYLHPKQNIFVQQITYRKDFMAIRVETENKKSGWLVSDGNIEVIEP